MLQYIIYYWEVLGASNSTSKALDLFGIVATAYAKKPFSAVLRWIMRCTCLFVTDMYHRLMHEQIQQCRFDLVSKLAAEFFSATESSLSGSRSNFQDPPWVKDVYLRQMKCFIEAIQGERQAAQQPTEYSPEIAYKTDTIGTNGEADAFAVSESLQWACHATMSGSLVAVGAVETTAGPESSQGIISAFNHGDGSGVEAARRSDAGSVGGAMEGEGGDVDGGDDSDGAGVVTALDVVEWGLKRGWGSAAAKKGKTSATNSRASVPASSASVLTSNQDGGDGEMEDGSNNAEGEGFTDSDVNCLYSQEEEHVGQGQGRTQRDGSMEQRISTTDSLTVEDDGCSGDRMVAVAEDLEPGMDYVAVGADQNTADRPSSRTRKRDRQTFTNSSSSSSRIRHQQQGQEHNKEEEELIEDEGRNVKRRDGMQK
jgi:hypothetical protein